MTRTASAPAKAPRKTEIVEETPEDSNEADTGWKTVLFNCQCHTFDQVEEQLIKAIRCTLSAARKFSMEVHTKGSAVVFRGAKDRCDDVAMTLGEIGLLVKVVK